MCGGEKKRGKKKKSKESHVGGEKKRDKKETLSQYFYNKF